MVSTRHHPRPFPEPTLTPSRNHNHTSATSTSSSPTKDTPPSPTEPTPSTIKRRSTSTRRKTIVTSSDVTSTSAPRSSSRRSRSVVSSSAYVHRPTSLTLTWMLISIPLVTWDTLYVLLRPHTMPGGKYHSPFWTPYALYGTVDYMYGWPAWNANNGFTAAQGSLNVIESLMYGFYLYIVAREVKGGWNQGIIQKIWRQDEEIEIKGRLVAEAVLICFSGCVMTVSKTILYWLNEAYSNFEGIGHNSAFNLFWLWIVPNGAWIVLPTYIGYLLWEEMLQHMKGTARRKA